MGGRNSDLDNMFDDPSRQATMDTILKRNNSISVVKRHAIPYGNLHKKTYFNALEKILISPGNLKKMKQNPNEVEDEQLNIHQTAMRCFEDVFKKPPSRLGEEQPEQ